MANSPQAKKRARQNMRRMAINKSRLSRVRTYIRNVERALITGDADAAREALKRAQPEIMRGVTKGVIHRKNASRKISRLSRRIKVLSQ